MASSRTPIPDDAEREGPSPAGSPGSLAHRLKLGLASTAGYWVVRVIGCTLRWQVEGWHHRQALESSGRPSILVFWHGRILPATYFWRNRGIVVMTSQNRDGEYIASVIRRFGYGAARGSSSRGGRRALVEMLHFLRRNVEVAFTIDGPRGPRYIAKPGAVWLAAKSGHAVLPFHISLKKKWVLSSWDQFQIPKPFTRALVLIGAPIEVRGEATDEEMEQAQKGLQHSLESMLEHGDSYWGGRATG